MFGSMVLEVAIGMVFVYLLLSLVLTALTEIVAGAMRWRAKDLWQGIRTLLESGDSDLWVNKLYEHPLIQGLSPRTKQDKPAARKPGKMSGRGPSYIPSRTFSLALLQILREPREALKREIRGIPDDTSLEEVKSKLSTFLTKLPDDPTSLRDALQKQVDGIAKQASTAELKKSLLNMTDMPLADLIAEVPNDKLRRSLAALLDESREDLEALKENMEIWFNNSMTRVSGWYKRRTQTFHLVFGIILAVALNVDTILIVKALSENQTLRQSIVSQAEEFAKNSSPDDSGSNQPKTEASGSRLPAGGTPILITSSKPEIIPAPTGVQVPEGQQRVSFEVTTKTVSTAHAVSLTVVGSLADFALLNVEPSPAERYSALRDQIDQLGLPIGWILPSDEAAPKNADYRLWPGVPFTEKSLWTRTLLNHVIGWLLTAFAISLGAPFWFDLLNKFISIRSSGRAPEEKPKAPKTVPTPLEPGQTPMQAQQVQTTVEEKKG